MKFKINFSRPDFIFSFVWIFTMILSYSFKTIYTVPFNMKVTTLIGMNIISSIFIYYIFKNRIYGNSINKISYLDQEAFYQLKKWTYYLIALWFVGFVINVMFSRGVPLYWRLIGDSRTYTEFGVPSFSGLLNAVRLFSSVALMVLLLNRFGIKEVLLLCLLLISSLLELSRGNFTFLLITALGVVFLFKKFDWKMIFVFVLGVIGFLIFFGFIGNVRGNSGTITNIVDKDSVFKNLPHIFIWGISYITSPLNNLNYAAEWITPTYLPKYSFMGMVPTVIRESLIGPLTYPVHIANWSLNATTFYSPLIADFGFAYACLIVTFLQIFITAIYMEAKKGNIFAQLVYPILLSSIILSVFYMYLFTLMVVFYICLSWIISRIQMDSGRKEVCF